MLLTQKELAVILGVGFPSVTRWGNGYYEPTIRIKRKIRFLLKDAGIKEQ